MYDNIAALRFDTGMDGEMVASAMVSAEGEVMELKQPVPAEGRVEDWMTGVLLEMRRTNRLITKEAIYFYSHRKTRWGHALNHHESVLSIKVLIELACLSD